MTLKFFSIFAGGALAVVIAIIAIVKNTATGFAKYGNKPLVIAILTSVLDALILFGATYLVDDDPFVTFWIMAAIFLVFGVIHYALMHKKFSYDKPEEKNKTFGAEVLFAFAVMLLTIVLFSVSIYFIKGSDFLFYPLLLSVIPFLIPLFFAKSFEAATDIPQAAFNVWEYPVGQNLDLPPENPNEKVFDIVFEIPKKATDVKKTYFRALAPENMALGELFYFFINDYNSQQNETPIEITDNKKQPIVWWFREKRKWYQFNKVLTPFDSIKYNGVIKNSVIICEHYNPAE